jgi:hypothetical protein
VCLCVCVCVRVPQDDHAIYSGVSIPLPSSSRPYRPITSTVSLSVLSATSSLLVRVRVGLGATGVPVKTGTC